MTLVHASLFSGIGGPEVAAAMMGWTNAFHCEINPFGRKVLEYWSPESKSYEDITKTDFRPWRGKIDILTGGFPCQPFSFAGLRKGREDERYLWPQMCRVINEIRPTWVIGENVAGITTMVEGGILSHMGHQATLFGEGDGVHRYTLRETFTIERICKDLEDIGYSIQPMLIPAAAVGAPHRRDRIFFIAHRASDIIDGQRRPAQREVSPQCDTHCRGSHQGDEQVQSEKPDGSEPPCHGGEHDATHTADDGCGRSTDTRAAGEICGEAYGEGSNAERSLSAEAACIGWTASDANCAGREEPIGPEWRENSTKDAARMDHRAERPCSRWDFADTYRERLSAALQSRGDDPKEWDVAKRSARMYSHDAWLEGTWWDNFPTVSPVHRGNDGLPFDVDGLTVPPIPGPPTYGKGDPQRYPFGKWRTESLKAYGNAIVPEVMYRIFQAIESTY